MENKKLIIAIVIVLILILGIVGITYLFSSFGKKQMKLLTEESNKILQSDISKDNIDLDIKTEKNYATVEKAIKEYILEIKNIYVEMEELNTGINPNSIFSTQNMQDKDLKEIDDIITEYKDKSQKCISRLEELMTEKKILENIEKRNISSRKGYYTDLYNTIMLSDMMKEKYTLLNEKVKDEKSKLYEKINKIDKINEFLRKNSDSWTIKDDKIQFTNLNRMTEYYNLLNQLTD